MLSVSSLGFTKLSLFHPTNLFARSLMASSKIVAEYAKSNRSSCKKCSNPISSDTLMLGLVTRNQGGFDITKWHHLNCLPKTSQSLKSVEDIGGFSLLKPIDQQALRNLPKETKVRKADDIEEDGEMKERKSKKAKHEEEVEVEIEISEVKAKSDYKGVELMPKWKSFQTVIFNEKEEGLTDSSKIAAFDFDGCLAKTNVRKVGAEAWSLMYSSIPEKLKKLYEEGFKIVIFTNEANIERWKNKRKEAIESKVGRLNGFIKRVEVPVQVFIACGHGEDRYRKPNVGMWKLLEKHFNSGIKIDMEESFYVGDAAGREGDHGDGDIKFARTNGLKFHLPEDYFAE